MTINWTGVYPAVTTKFDAQLDLDQAAYQQHIRALIASGVDGIIVAGSLGENSTLSFEEKLQLAEWALAAVDQAVPVLLTIAEGSSKQACQLIAEADKRGVDAYMVLPGMRYVADRAETLQHFRAVATATAKPIMVYNNPVAYGVDVTPEMFAELQNQQNLVAIKESSDDIRRVTEIINLCGQRYRIFCGVDNLALEAFCMGAAGWVAGLVGAYAKETVAIYQLYQQGQFEQAREIYRWFAPLLKLDVSSKLVQNIKLAESLAGFGTEYVRPPRLPLAGKERAEVLEVIQKANQSRPDLTQ